MPTTEHDVRWRWLLFALCGLLAIYAAGQAADNFGLGGRPWYGFYDAQQIFTPGLPYTITFEHVEPGGATARSGIRSGDRLDFRDVDLTARVALISQPAATQPIKLTVRRGGERLTTAFNGSTWEDVQPVYKVVSALIPILTSLWCCGCVLLIAIRRWWSVDGRGLAIVLSSLGLGATFPTPAIVVPQPVGNIALWYSLWILGLATMALLIFLSSKIGTRSAWRGIIEWLGYAATALMILAFAAGAVGLVTLRIDPIPFSWLNPFNAFAVMGITLMVVVAAAAGVASAAKSERPRAAWLLLPLPIAFAAIQAASWSENFAQSWVELMNIFIISEVIALLAALFVTYALLKRRVLDTGFLLSRTIVVGIVSLIMVAAFVLLEWMLGLTLANASHGTGLIANAALALGLGVSLRYVHRRVDTFVDAVFFRRRYENERVLREFSTEAAFVTERKALLDRAVELVRDHTDACMGALLVRENGSYKAARGFGEAPADVGENDPAILALKARHRPFDPHSYASAMRGALAVPMVARGHLIGVLLCGERAGGEAYAPDEVDALVEFAHGVGSALDALGNEADTPGTHVLLGSIDLRLQSIERLLSDGRRST
jgi:hypothetical protein